MRLLIITAGLLLWSNSKLPAQNKIYLVSVGIADYPGTANDLKLPAADAETMQWVYRKNKKAETSLLTNTQATQTNILSSMKRLYAKAGVNDIVVFFFSGHGYPGGFVGYNGNINYDHIKQVMAECPAKNKMIFADACFSGKMRGKKRNSQSHSNSQVMLFLSSRDNEVSIENRSMKNGYFTACLQRGLGGAADNDKNRIITARELFLFVSQSVKELTNDKQHPVMWGKFNDSMPVMIW